ncbi:CcmA Integral membrane protein CcmA involved in cell shape determination [Burkholderiaceae bacterium]
MFNKNSSAKPLSPSKESFGTIIDEFTEVHGRLVSSTSLRIDGKVIGNVEASQENNISIAIGKSGSVQGDIYAYRIFVAGKVTGNIYCSERVELHDGAEVTGDVTYGQIGVEPGAKLNGLMIFRNKEAAPELQDSVQIFQKDWQRITK